jgi:D-alanine-D-alanine ligase
MATIAVLMGGKSAERQISLTTGKAVSGALRARGHAVIEIDAAAHIAELLEKAELDAVFIALHGRWGEDGTVQGLLEMMGIPYTGSGVLASALAMDKTLSKRVFLSLGVPTPDFQLLEAGQGAEAIRLPVPFVVKPPREGSTIGISIVRQVGEAAKAVEEARKHSPEVLVEAFVDGRELTVGVLNGNALPIVEIIPEGGFYDFTAKYLSKGTTRYECPAALSAEEAQAVSAAGVAAYRALGCAGAARVDVLLDRAGRPWVLEANTIPGMTPTSLLPKAAAAAGMDFETLVEAILAGASLKA